MPLGLLLARAGEGVHEVDHARKEEEADVGHVVDAGDRRDEFLVGEAGSRERDSQ